MLKQKHRCKSTKKGILILKGGKYYRISNFGAKILEEIELKRLDGTVERVLRIRVCLRGRVFEIMTSYAQFMNGEWIGIHLGLDAEVYHDHISAKEFPKVIAKESNDKHKITKTQKLGFHQHDGEPYFFYNGGSLSADGSNNLALMAEVDGTLNKCKIPMMAEDDVLKELITQFLDLANIVPKNLSLGSLFAYSSESCHPVHGKAAT